MDEIPLEATPEDVIEQRTEVSAATDDEAPMPISATVPWDADPADVAEQRAEVPLDEDWA